MAAASPSAAAIEHSRLLSKQHSDGGWGVIPIQSRLGRFTSFDVSEFEPVTGFEEAWKYTPVKLLSTLIDEPLDGSRPQIESSVEGAATVEWVDRGSKRIGEVGKPEDKASANAWSHSSGAWVIDIEKDGGRVDLQRTGSAAPAAGHLVFNAASGSTGTIVLRNVGSAQLAENLEISVGDGAVLTVVTIQDWTAESTQLSSTYATLGRDARLHHLAVTLGGSVVRMTNSTHLAGQGGEAELLGVYFADSNQHLEHQIFVNHDAPNTKSRVNYRGALNGDNARTVWVGDVLIRPSAIGTDSYEENRNLLLSDGGRADSVPNLEIETGDILGAGHASASGRFDDEQLFYLQARGITEDEARRLVVRGFLSGIVQKIHLPDIAEDVERAIDLELGGRAE
ncbi:MAG: Fe-S cluster assembly protein SufD [Cryobacterium sp.]|nr:Fe-S cluster assembly protein SufD [Cryobacterium sp.]MBX3090590.1 Fe-S cluster assembly protein SufD [Cryobacterium sp.]MBX3116271.1 Fe-S cluster assembly protein SufD [Cryobacterium sp.]MCC7128470.1 Fe-S cluster assembly protein SufD [Microbacteriaceae bacterium]MCO5293981.1 Fe-S cluster assembly protein SufD [Homoserinimonas sp.]